MSELIQRDSRLNNSISADKTLGVLEILEKIKESGSGVVSYVFNTERLLNVHANPKDNKNFGATRNHTYMINAPINKEVFLSEKSTTIYNKKLTEVLEVFKSTCHDMGASYFVLS